MIAQLAELDPNDAPDDRGFRRLIPQATQPVLIGDFTGRSDVVNNGELYIRL